MSNIFSEMVKDTPNIDMDFLQLKIPMVKTITFSIHNLAIELGMTKDDVIVGVKNREVEILELIKNLYENGRIVNSEGFLEVDVNRPISISVDDLEALVIE